MSQGLQTAPKRARRRLHQCPHCDEIFVDEDSFEKHKLTHDPNYKSPPRPIVEAPPKPRPAFLPRDNSPRLLLLLFLACWSVLCGLNCAQLLAPTDPPEVRQQMDPARNFLDQTLGSGRSHLALLESSPLRLIATLDCPADEARLLDAGLRNLLSLDPAQGDSLLTVAGPAPLSTSVTAFKISTSLFALLCLLSVFRIKRQVGCRNAFLQRVFRRSAKVAGVRAMSTAPSWRRLHAWKLSLLCLILLALSLAVQNRDSSRFTSPEADRLRVDLAQFIQTDGMVVEVCTRNLRCATVVAWLHSRPDPSEMALVENRVQSLGLEPGNLSSLALDNSPWRPLSAVPLSLVNLLLLTFWPLGFGLCLGVVRARSPKTAPVATRPEPIVNIKTEAPKSDSVSPSQVDALTVEIGRALLPLIEPTQGSKLLDRISRLRRNIALELGIVMPVVRFRENLKIEGNAYLIKLRNNEVARGKIRSEDSAVIFDSVNIVATQIDEVVRQYAADLLGRQEFEALLDAVKTTHPALIGEVCPHPLSPRDLHKIARTLLREQVSIRDLVLIIETVASHLNTTQDLTELAELARKALCRQTSQHCADSAGVIHVTTLDLQVEQLKQAGSLSLDDEFLLIKSIGRCLTGMQNKRLAPILFTNLPEIRAAIRKLTERVFPALIVLSPWDIAPKYTVCSEFCAQIGNLNELAGPAGLA